MLKTYEKSLSILFPEGPEKNFRLLSDTSIHDLGLQELAKEAAGKPEEENLILNVLKRISGDADVIRYRLDIFEDIKKDKKLRENVVKVLDRINFLRDYGSFRKEKEESAGTWDLLHRLEEIRDYIQCVEAFHTCLESADIQSEGLKKLRDYVQNLYSDHGFAELKKDIEALHASTANLKSVTLGINLNERFEAQAIGLISINDKPFTHSGIIKNFASRLNANDEVHKGTDWKGDMHFDQFSASDDPIAHSLERYGLMQSVTSNVLLASKAHETMQATAPGSGIDDVTRYMDRIANRLLSATTKNLRNVLGKYVSLTITNMTDLLPEFVYYIRMAEFVEKLQEKGYHFCKPVPGKPDRAEGFYNLKLAVFGNEDADHIVPNDLDFSDDHTVYILTGANRGGKTTLTQAVALLYALASGGIYVSADRFEFMPVDCIFTHFPADEDKTMDLGRLGEECKRFKEIFREATGQSLLLLNETFSTTSFEEGYFIARDAVRAMLQKGVRTIYNTHMHKLAFDIDEMNGESERKAASLVMRSDEGRRSFKVHIAPPEGLSYAMDIAVKYGVTYEMLTEETRR